MITKKANLALVNVPVVRVMGLNQPYLSFTLEEGTSCILGEGVTLTLGNNSTDCLLEVTRETAQVKVGDVSVVDVKHVPASTFFSVDGQNFVVLPPYHVFSREQAGEEGEQRHESMLAAMVNKEAFLAHVLAGDSEEQKPRVSHMNFIMSFGPAKKMVKNPQQIRHVVLMIGIFVAGVGVASYLMKYNQPSNDVAATNQAIGNKAETQVQATTLQAAPTASQATTTPTASQPAVPAVVSTESDQVKEAPSESHGDSSLSEVDRIAKLAAQVPSPVAANEKLSELKQAAPRRAAKVSMKPNSSAKTAARKDTEPKVTTEKLASWRTSLDRYVLEANYDPERALEKMRALLKDVPAGHSFAEKIKNEINAVRR